MIYPMETRTEWIGTTEAARRLGVDDSTIRYAVLRKQLPARRSGAIWLIEATVLDSFRKPAPQRNRKRDPLTPTAKNSLRLLAEWGSATADELSIVIEVNAGNVRKGLAIAEKLALATRDGSDWSLTESGHQWLVEHDQEVAA
jgi:excisionase family DNA binding protein